MALITPARYRNIIIVTGIWIGIMAYAMVLCWRAYEKSKCIICFMLSIYDLDQLVCSQLKLLKQ